MTTATREEWPVHRPLADEAPIPGVHHYSGCSDDHPRVKPDGTCEDCGKHACPECGAELCECVADLPYASLDGAQVLDLRARAGRGEFAHVWETLTQEGDVHYACGNMRAGDRLHEVAATFADLAFPRS